MRVVVQRITFAEVVVDNTSTDRIEGPGLLCLVGFGKDDKEDVLEVALNKILNLRISLFMLTLQKGEDQSSLMLCIQNLLAHYLINLFYLQKILLGRSE
jgi:D-Tyr-tRNAtyr deacylase